MAKSGNGGNQLPAPTPPPQPQSLSESVVAILSQQQSLMAQMTKQLAATQQALRSLSRDEVILDSLSSNMSEFVYNKDDGHTFEAWFSRYADLFEKDAARLDDDAKVRLLLRKLSPPDHERYHSFILPMKPNQFSFDVTVEKLTTLFGATVSIFRRRFNCLQTTKNDSDDYLTYSCKVNKSCVDFKLSELSEGQFKCLIFILGLKSKQDAEVRMRLINKLNDSANLTLEQVVEQCNSIVNLKQDTVLVEAPSTSAVSYVAHDNKRSKPVRRSSSTSPDREKPRTPCWSCGGMHFNKDCRYREHKCRDCGKEGHKEGYCTCFKTTSSDNAASTSKAPKKNKKQHQPSTKSVTVGKISEGRRFVGVQLNNIPLRLQLDTGSDITIISHRSWIRIGQPAGKPTRSSAKTASGKLLKLVAEFNCSITLDDVTKEGKCFVAAPNVNLDILGIDLMDMFELWDKPISSFCKHISSSQTQGTAEVQARCRNVFTTKMGLCNLQALVDKASQPPLPINTQKGLVQCTRLSPGVKSGPGAFQKLMDIMLTGLNDVTVGGQAEEEHQRNRHRTLQRLRQVKHLGQILDAEGIRPDPDKITPIIIMQSPHNGPTLRSYLGAYYGKHVKEMRTLRQLMDQLLKTGTKFVWSPACQKSFNRFRELLQSPLLLTHYNPKLEIIVSADASNVGLGARIAHKFPDGSVKAIYHVSRSLTSAESNYSQVEKEGLALIFAVKRFHRMIFGRRFTLETDHKPLLAIFGSKKGIPIYTANRLQRWALTLLLYDFNICYVSTDSFGHADVLSRLMNRHVKPEEEFVIAHLELERSIRIVINESLQALPLSYKVIQGETRTDSTLQQVIRFVNEGWPTKKSSITDPQLQQFYLRRDGLSVVAGCLMYADRLVVPPSSRKRVLQQLHKGHPGVERMRSIARQYVYWPNIDEDVAKLVRTCNECASVARTDRKTNLESWPAPEKPWQRLHLDYAGPMDGQYYLILVDSYSKWPEVVRTKEITTTATLRMLRKIFATHGLPETLVTDNGTQFTSDQFARYCDTHGITHLRTAPFHPQSNGLAERFVDTFKRSLKKITAGGETLEEAIETFLLCYRSTPNRSAPDGKSPAELVFGRPVRTSLELLRPPTPSHKISDSGQEKQFNRKHGTKARNYSPQDLVWVKVYRNNKWSWEAGTVIERVGKVMYNIWLPSKQDLVRSHCNQLRTRYQAEDQDQPTHAAADNRVPLAILLDSWGLQPGRINSSPEPESEAPLALLPELEEGLQPPEQQSRPSTSRSNQQQQPIPTRQSSRIRRPPVRYEAYHLS